MRAFLLSAPSALLLAWTTAFAGPLAVRGEPDGPANLDDIGPGTPAVNASGMAAGTTDLYATNGTYQGPRGMRWNWSGSHAAQLNPVTTNFSSVSYPWSVAVDLSDSGYIVGNAYQRLTASTWSKRAVRWDGLSSTPVALAALSSQTGNVSFAEALAVNESGIAVGWASRFASNVGKGDRAVRWALNGTVVELGHLGTNSSNSTSSRAVAINDAGAIAGYATRYFTDDSYVDRGVRWDAGSNTATELLPLGSVSSTLRSQALALTPSGAVFGWAEKMTSASPYPMHFPVRWNAGSNEPIQLGTLSVGNGQTGEGMVVAVNDHGLAVGTSSKAANLEFSTALAVRWLPGSTTPVELGHLGLNSSNQTVTRPRAVNNAGVIVGYCQTWVPNNTYFSDGLKATVWMPETTAALNLNTLGIRPLGNDSGTWILSEATDISDTGFISGYGSYDPDGAGSLAPYKRMFVLMYPAAGTYGQGDATLDTHVDFADLLVVAQNYGNSNPTLGVTSGDFDLSGATDFQDLLALAQHYNASTGAVTAGGEDFAADWALARSLVPEPGLLGLALALPLMRGRSRREVTSA